MSSDMIQWYVLVDETAAGPFDLERIHRLIDLGDIKAKTYVAPLGEEWTQAREDPILAPLIAAVPRWHILVQDQVKGPGTAEQFRRLIQGGYVSSDIWVRRLGEGRWRKAVDDPALRAAYWSDGLTPLSFAPLRVLDGSSAPVLGLSYHPPEPAVPDEPATVLSAEEPEAEAETDGEASPSPPPAAEPDPAPTDQDNRIFQECLLLYRTLALG